MQIFSLVGEILLKDNNTTSKLDAVDKKASGVSKSMGLSFGSIASAALKVGSIIGVSMGFKSMIDGAAASQQKLTQMDSVLKSTGGVAGMTKDELVKLADAQGKLTTFSKGANLATENLLLTFTNIGKKTFPDALKSVNDMSQALGQDAKSSAIQLGKALNDPIKGITALSRVGVSFTAQQKEQIAAMQKAGDTAGAQSIILKELQKEFGGSAEAAGKTFGGQLAILKNQLNGVGTQFGTVILPYLTKFLNWVNDHMPQIQKFISDAMKVVGDAFKSVADFVQVNLMPIFDSFLKWIQPHMPEIKKIVGDVFNVIKGVFKLVGDYITNVLIPVYKGMAEWFFENFPKIKDAVMKAYDYIKPSLDSLVKAIKEDVMPIIKGLWDTFQKAMPGIKGICEIVFPIIVRLIKLVIDVITDFIKIVKGIYDFIKPGLDNVAEIFSAIFGNIKSIFTNLIDFVKNVFTGNWKGAWNNIKNIFSDVFKSIGIIWKAPLNAMISGINGFLGGIGKIKIPDWVPGIGGRGFNIPKIPMLAGGTDFFQGGYAIVGEKGPELVRMPRGSEVDSNEKTQKMLSNGITLQIINFYNNRKEDIEELAQELQFYINQKNKGLGGAN